MTRNYYGVVVQALFREYEIPSPVLEYRFHKTRKWRFDMAWPRIFAKANGKIALGGGGVYLEIDGGLWTGGRHTRGAALVKDYEKRNAATVLGWRGLWTTPEGLTSDAMLKTIAAALKGE